MKMIGYSGDVASDSGSAERPPARGWWRRQVGRALWDSHSSELFMPAYKDVDGDSGIVWFDVGPDWIELKWERGRSIYRYTYESAGAVHVEEMKRLAARGNGLNTYLNQHAARNYASKRPSRPA